MRTPFLLFLSLSILLSGCITANTAIFKPEPDSGGDMVARVWGGFWSIGFFGVSLIYGLTYLLFNVPGFAEFLVQEDIGLGELGLIGYSVILLISTGAILVDTAIRDTLPYRKAYYQEKEAEEEVPEEEPSKESP